jgi:hypothetical protein
MPSGPTACLLFLRDPLARVHILWVHIHPSDVNPTHYFGSSHFMISGFKSLCINTSHFSRQSNSQNYSLLFYSIQRTRSFSQIYGVDLLRTSEFQVSGFVPQRTPLFLTSRTPKRLLGYPPGTFSGYNGHKGFSFFLNRSYGSNTPSVECPLSLWSNTTPTVVLFYRYFS